MLRILRVHSPELRKEVFALRYRAYRSQNAIAERFDRHFEDKYDHQPNHALWALTDEGRVVGSMRVTWYDPAMPHLNIPEQEAYAATLGAFGGGQRLVSGNRFVTEPDRSQRNSLFPLLLLRQYMAIAERRADVSLAAVRARHLAFYRRVLHLRQVSAGAVYPGLNCVMYLTACDFKEHADAVYSNTPELRPSEQCSMLADDSTRGDWELGVPVEG